MLMTHEELSAVVDEVVQIAGFDTEGRAILLLFACRLPPHRLVSYDDLLALIFAKLAASCASPYILLYFATAGGGGETGYASNNIPPWSWLYSTYARLPRDYRKNIQRLFIIHPSRWPKMLIKMMAAIVSPKFSRKVVWIDRLGELRASLSEDFLASLTLPPEVLEAEWKLDSAQRNGASTLFGAFGTLSGDGSANLLGGGYGSRPSSAALSSSIPSDGGAHSLFLHRILAADMGVGSGSDSKKGIPPQVLVCTSFIKDEGLECEGIFRASPSSTLVESAKRAITLGQLKELFSRQGTSGSYLAAHLLKMYVRDLREPFFPPSMYPQLEQLETHAAGAGVRTTVSASYPKEKSIEHLMRSFCSSLPPYKRSFCLHLFSLLSAVAASAPVNLMNPSNLAIVWAPNFVHGPDAMLDFDISSKYVCTWVRMGIESPDRYFG